MPYQKSLDRNQMMFYSLDSMVSPDCFARIIDIFIDSLDLKSMGFAKSTPAKEGRPSYSANDLLKLYLYGYRQTIRSSRKLEEACKINVELKWLLKGLEPDFRTISDFRKDNIEHLKKVFHEFNRRLIITLETGFYAIDGTKIQASNSKKRNYTANKLDDKIKKVNETTEYYLKQIEAYDSAEDEIDPNKKFTKDELKEKLEKTRKRLTKLIEKQKEMETRGLSQISLTDSDSKLMKTRNGFSVAYNVQTAVDSKTHLIKDFKVTDRPSDFGLLSEIIEKTKKEKAEEVVEVVADKGYECPEDMVECLEKGVIPNVMSANRKKEYELETVYEYREIDEKTRTSKNADDIKKCLRAGVIPEVYKDVIKDIVIKNKRTMLEADGTAKVESPAYKRTEKEMKARALEGYFVRDLERNIVYCPGGFTLRPAGVRRNGQVGYTNKVACRECPTKNICNKTKKNFMEIKFCKDSLEKPCKGFTKSQKKTVSKKRTEIKWIKKNIVKFIFKPDFEKMKQRKNISEHPFGTIKRALNGGHFLLRNKFKTSGEFALFSLAYNLKRSQNLFRFNELMAIMG